MGTMGIWNMTLNEGSPVSILDQVIKSSIDKCRYRYLTLPNGLEALLMSEDGLDKASAALDVHVGSFSDPQETPGLAHFLEHLLFMGTSKYPDENDYSQFLSSHGGHSNAFTAEEHTNYFFDVAADHLEDALDRFAQFFISPLFNPSGTERELLAVDSEHKKNLQNDGWRVHQLEKTLSSESHPFHHFGTGDVQTLGENPKAKGIDIRNVLIDFYKKHYSANLMKLVVYGKESLDELQTMVISKFAAVTNCNFELEVWPGKPLDERHFGKLIRVKTLKDSRQLSLAWQLEDLSDHLEEKPEHYISHLVGHEGHGSILSLLKARSWATNLSAGARPSRGYAFFHISIELSKNGLEHIPEIVEAVFQYLYMIRALGPQRWIFDETQKLEEIAFEFMEKGQPSSFTHQTAGNMQLYPPELALKGPRVSLQYTPKLIQSVMDQLTVENFRIIIETNEDLDPAQIRREVWYGTEYTIEDIDPLLIKSLANPAENPELFVPKPNLFLPEKLTSKQSPAENPIMHPNPLLAEEQIKLWHKQDDIFGMPKGCFQFVVKSPLVNASPRSSVTTHLFIQLFMDSITELVYEAQAAGLSLDMVQHTNGIAFSFCGYDDKLDQLIEAVVPLALRFRCDPERLHVIKDRYSRRLKNLVHENPYSLLSYYMNGVQQVKHWWFWQKEAALESIHSGDVDELVREVFTRCNVEALCHGNFFADEARSLLHRLENMLGTPSLISQEEAAIVPTIRLRPRQDLLFVPHSVPNLNAAIDVFLQIGPATDQNLRTLAMLFAQIFHEPFFDQLRTKEQLGYIVFHQYHEVGTSMGLRFLCQSERDPVFLDNRIETFLANVEAALKALTDTQYKAHISALVSKLLAKKRKMSDETQVYWGQITMQQYEFERAQRTAAHLPSISKEDLIQFVKERVLHEAPLRSKLSVHLWPERLQKERNLAYMDNKDTQLFDDPDQLKGIVDVFPVQAM